MYSRTALGALVCLIALGACAGPRPIHPMRLEGFPGAPIEPDLFPFADGGRWIFEDRVKPGREPVRLEMRRGENGFILSGRAMQEALVRKVEGFVQVEYEVDYEVEVEGKVERRKVKVVGRPFKLQGNVGDTWEHSDRVYTVFGYETLDVLGRTVRALVVAVDKPPERELHWYAPEIGWVRLRTERSGQVVHDAILVEFEPGVRIDAGPEAG